MLTQKIQLRAYSEKTADGRLRIVATDETLDRSGESIPFESWDLTNFLKSPRLLIDHDYSVKSIVGKCGNVEKDESRKAITFEPLFHDITQAAKDTKEMVEQGFLDTVSVGFLRNEDEKGSQMNELMEISFVAVPANPNARMLAVKSIEPAAEKAIEEFIEKAVVPKHDPPMMDEGAEWDGSAAEKNLQAWAGGDNMDWGKYKEGFAWFDSANAETLGAYKLPHHDVEGGELKTNWKGVAAAMAALLGARGGVDVPDSEKKGIYDHLAEHYKQFSKEPPAMDAAPEEPKEGDPCKMDDGTDGVMAMDDSGNMVCMLKKAPPAEEPAGDDDMQELQMCLAAADKCHEAVRAAIDPSMSPDDMAKAVDAAFAELATEITACLSDMGEGGDGTQEGKGLKSGRVLSSKNREIIKTARESMQIGVGALDELLAATEPSESSEASVKTDPEKKGREPRVRAEDDSFDKFVALRKVTRAVNAALNDALRDARLKN